jgi:hypothetical protein
VRDPVPVNGHVPGHRRAASADTGLRAPGAEGRPARCLIVVLLLATAALDLTRCGLVLATVRHPASAGWLVAAGLAAAALSSGTARGCLAGWRWPTWAALLIGAASAPQAAASGFGAPYTVPDTATVVLGILLAVTVLATAGHAGAGQHAQSPCPIDKEIIR